ncbi:MAG: hypothetical protein M0R39_06905 [Prolixibacteraceae bacterium]|nr:hypothetical protein [Prolixibacteraceae bacterium]
MIPITPDITKTDISKKEGSTAQPKNKGSETGKKVGVKVVRTKTFVSSASKDKLFTVVAIGASAGGLEAVTQLLENLSPTTGMVYIYVQHLSPDHKSLLTSILSKVTEMAVQEIDDMEKMEPNNVYVIPADKEIEVTDGHIKLLV